MLLPAHRKLRSPGEGKISGDAYTTLCKAAIRGSFLYPELFLTEYLNGAYKMLRTRFTEMRAGAPLEIGYYLGPAHAL